MHNRQMISMICLLFFFCLRQPAIFHEQEEEEFGITSLMQSFEFEDTSSIKSISDQDFKSFELEDMPSTKFTNDQDLKSYGFEYASSTISQNNQDFKSYGFEDKLSVKSSRPFRFQIHSCKLLSLNDDSFY